MSLLLDVPWAVNEESERISTHGGLASLDFNGTVPERREAMRLVAQAQEMARLIRDVREHGMAGARWDERSERVLRDAGVLE